MICWMNDLIRTSGLKECAMQWLHCLSAYFRGRPVFLVFSNIFGLIFESAYFRRSANFRGNTVSLIWLIRRSFENLSYISSCSLSKRWRFRRIHLNVLRGIHSDIAHSVLSNKKLLMRGQTSLDKFWRVLFYKRGTNDQFMLGGRVRQMHFPVIWTL